MHKLFISGFPLEISELDLAKLVAPHGNISTIKIVRDRKTRVCKGYAFIEMQTLDDAMNVIQALNGAEMAARELTVNLVEEKPVMQRPSSEGRGYAGKYSNSGGTFSAPPRAKRPRKTT